MRFRDTNRSSNLGQTIRPCDSKTNSRKVDFAVPADHKVRLKESEKRDKYLDLAREQKKTMKHESDNDTNWGAWHSHQKTCGDHSFLRWARILRGVQETLGDLL